MFTNIITETEGKLLLDTFSFILIKKTAVKPLSDENEGAAVFLYEDKAKGIKQKFAFSLRYYVGEHAIGDPL
jgi:hypothetical protein